jgi:SpoVK/Ycf46/Vps4 family AAA+-type ATPase
MNFEEQLGIYLRARFPLIIVPTVEEGRALDNIRNGAQAVGWGVVSWELAGGFKTDAGSASPQPASDPVSALEQVSRETTKTVFVLKDFHEFWSDAMVKRRLKNTAQSLRKKLATIIVLTPSRQIPPELTDEIVQLELLPPDEKELGEVLNHLCTSTGVKVDLTSLGRRKLTQAAIGLTRAQAERVFSRAIVTDGKIDDNDITLVNDEKKEIIRESEALEFYAAQETPDDIGGLDQLKQWLDLRQQAWSQEAVDFGLPAPKGIALIGIPGTGKSLTAKMIGGLWRLPLMRLDVGALFGSLVGESEERVRRVLKLTETIAPCVLWIDELEKSFAGGGLDGGTSQRVFGSILTWMQDKTAPVFVVATANDVSLLPPELLRRGRFDEIFFLDLPTEAERQAIFEVHLRKRDRAPHMYDLEALARSSAGYVGAELEQAVIDAMYVAFNDGPRDVSDEDIRNAVSRMVPLSRSQRERVETLRAWLQEGRAQSASFAEKLQAESHSVPLDVQLEI